MSYIDDLEQAAAEALAASSSATDSAQIMADVANGDENTTVTTANGEVKTLAKAIKDIIDSIEAGVEAPQVEPQTLSAGQTTVTLSTMTTEGIAVYVEGSREFDFNVVNSTDFDFSQSFPDGTRIWVVKRDIEGVADSFTINTATGSQTLTNALDQRVIYVDTLADLQALPTSGLVDGQPSRVTGPQGGPFYWSSSDRSVDVTNDPGSIIFLPPDGADGSTGAWVRQFGQSVDGSPTAKSEWAVGATISSDTGSAINNLVTVCSYLEIKKIKVTDGRFKLSSGIVLPDTITLEGSGRDKTFLEPDAAVTAITFRSSNTVINGFTIRDPAGDQNNRVSANGIAFVPTSSKTVARKYLKITNVLIEYLDGFAIASTDPDASVIESRFEFVHIRHCGNSTTPCVDFYQEDTTSDSFNNITFSQFSVYAPHGVAISFVSHKVSSSYAGSRDIRFDNNCIIHGRAGGEGGPFDFDLIQIINSTNFFFGGLRVNTVASGRYGVNIDTSTAITPGMLQSRRANFTGASLENDVYIGDVQDALFENVSARAVTLEISANAVRTKVGLCSTRYNNAAGLIVSDNGTDTHNVYIRDRVFRGRVDGAGALSLDHNITASQLSTGQYRVSLVDGPSEWIPRVTSNVSDKVAVTTNPQASSVDVYVRLVSDGTLADGPFYISFDVGTSPI